MPIQDVKVQNKVRVDIVSPYIVEEPNRSINKFARNASLGDAVLEDVWDVGGTYVYPSGADITHIKAESDSEATRGKQIVVAGLDINWNRTIEVVTTDESDSTTEIELNTPLRRLYRMYNNTDTAFDENIQIGPSGFASIQGQITVGG